VSIGGIEPAECAGCRKPMERPAAVIPLAGDFVPVCSVLCIEVLVAAEIERITCAFCPDITPPNDRIPVPTADKVQRYCHARCARDMTLKLGLGKVSVLLRRSGPIFSRRVGEA
jgi:hypothetical protein